MKAIRVKSYAKVNLTLEVLGRRPDGFHEISSIMQNISLSDELSFEPAAELTLECDLKRLESAENLVACAAQLLQSRYAVRSGARIQLRKGIPIQAGLGGGSSDAATTLWALNRLWGLHRPVAELAALAAGLGSDVPFFLTGGTCLAEGRGDRLTRVPTPPQAWLVLALPAVSVSNKTAEMYRHLPPGSWNKGEATKNLRRLLEQGRRLRESSLFNVFSNLAAESYPEIGSCRSALLEAAWARPVLAGAGPALFMLVADRAQAASVVTALQGPGVDCWVTCTVPAAREEID